MRKYKTKQEMTGSKRYKRAKEKRWASLPFDLGLNSSAWDWLSFL